MLTSELRGTAKAVLSTQRQSLTNSFNAMWLFTRGKARRGEPLPKPTPNDPQRVFLLTIPLFHVTGNCTYLHLCKVILGITKVQPQLTLLCLSSTDTAVGGKIILIDKWDAKKAVKIVEKEKVTNLGGVPSQPAELFEEKGNFSSVVGVSFGGAPPTIQLPKSASRTLSDAATMYVFCHSTTDWHLTNCFILNSGHAYGLSKFCV